MRKENCTQKNIIVIPQFLYPIWRSFRWWGVEVAAFASCKSLARSEGVNKTRHEKWAKETEKRKVRKVSSQFKGVVYLCFKWVLTFIPGPIYKTSHFCPQVLKLLCFWPDFTMRERGVVVWFYPKLRWRQWSTTSWCNSRTMLFWEKFPAKQLLQPPQSFVTGRHTVTGRFFLPTKKCSSFNRWVYSDYFGASWLYLSFCGGHMYSSCQWVSYLGWIEMGAFFTTQPSVWCLV